MPLITFEDTLGCLQLEQLAEGRYTAPNIPMAYYRVFGGQLLAQTIAIATHSADGAARSRDAGAASRSVKSVHAAFPREGDLRAPVEFQVDALQDGRSFAARQVSARQEDRLLCSAVVSLHVDEPGLDHQLPAPDVGDPDAAVAVDLSMIPWETRVVGGVDLASRDVGPADYALWMRAPGLPDDRAVHQALFAHATDLTLIGTTLRPHEGVSEADSPDAIQTAVTTHTVWFHRPFRLDDWLLLSQWSPVAAAARGFGQGHAFDRAGRLVASFAQESMIRPVS